MADSTHLEINHMQLQAAAEQSQNLEMFVLGHISAYDPATHRCKVIYPTYTDNSNQNYIESGWVPLATGWSGNGFGDQIAPFGGATIDDLTGTQNNPNAQPEQCIVNIVSREGTFHVMGAFMFNQQDIPAGSNQKFFMPDGSDQMLTISNGERVIKHSSGTYVHFKADGSINIVANTTPHNPYMEQDPSNLVRQVNVQAISNLEQNSNQNQTPDSITANVQASARTTGSADVQNVTATNNVVASATTGQNANATLSNTVGSTGTQTSTATGELIVQASGTENTTTTSNASVEAAANTGKDSTANTGVASTVNNPNASTATAVTGLTANAQGGNSTDTTSATNNIGASATTGQSTNATINVSVMASGQQNNTAAGSFTVSAPQGESQTASLDLKSTTGSQGAATTTLRALGSQNAQLTIHSDGNITISCPFVVTVDAPTINLGQGTMERILTDVAAQVYNNHTHGGVQGGSSHTSTPDQQITSEDEAQNAWAS